MDANVARTVQARTAMSIAGLVAASALFAATADAQERGPPSVLPRPDFHFPGDVGRTYADSDPAQFPQPVQAPKGAPNVVLILIDDVGFGQFSTFGGGVPSPTMDKLAAEGLRYNSFHTTALCSPTRAAHAGDQAVDGRHRAALAGPRGLRRRGRGVLAVEQRVANAEVGFSGAARFRMLAHRLERGDRGEHG